MSQKVLISYLRTPASGVLTGMPLESSVRFPTIASALHWLMEALDNPELSEFHLTRVGNAPVAEPAPLQIRAAKVTSSAFQGKLIDVEADEITGTLAVAPTYNPNPKSKLEWQFEVIRDGVAHSCAIWDWNGGGADAEWSYFGPAWVFVSLFGENRVHIGAGAQ